MATKYECDRCHTQFDKDGEMMGVNVNVKMSVPATFKDLCRTCHTALLRWINDPPAQAAPRRETDLTMPGLIRS